LETALAEARKFDRQLLVEEFVPGRELTIGILGDQALPILEIIPKGGFYDFTNKYPFLNPQAGGGAEHVCPAKIEAKLTRKIQESGLACVSLDWVASLLSESMCSCRKTLSRAFWK
jgi:D-alanine-D-alanine ligase